MADKIKAADPQLVINGKIVKPAPPKMKVWREFTAYDENAINGFETMDFLGEQYRLIAVAFGRPEITQEVVEEALDIPDALPLIMELRKWLHSQVFAKLAQLPNGEAGTD